MLQKSDKHRVVIIGGGFGGLWTARSLRRADVNIVLVDKRNFHLFQPLLYQVATGGLSSADIASPLRGILSRQQNISVVLGEMIGIDFKSQQAVLNDNRLKYDSLVVATGSENHYFGNNHWETVAPGLKTIEDARSIRNRIFTAFEKAEKEQNRVERRRLMTFVIIGGGPTGVELAGALAEIARITLRDNFRFIDPAEARIILLEGVPEILTTYHPELRAKAQHSLEILGVQITTGAFAEEIDDAGVTVLAGEKKYRLESRTVLWAAGVKPSPVAKLLVVDKNQLDKSGRVVVNQDLTLPGHPNVYVIGDLSCATDKSGRPLPGIAPVAMSQGKYVARHIIGRIKNRPVKPYRYRDRGNMAVLGRAAGIADLGWARFSGYPAWLLWLFVHLMYLVEFDNRLIVFIQWAWNYFTRNRGARLITHDDSA